ncbi:hypothetical protein [Streptomyces cinereoruber]
MMIHVFVSFVVVTALTLELRVRLEASRAQAREALSGTARWLHCAKAREYGSPCFQSFGSTRFEAGTVTGWGVVYVLCEDVSRKDVPAEQASRSGVTAWRRLRDRTEAGTWSRLHEGLLTEPWRAGLLDMDEVPVHASHVRASRREGLTPGLRRLTVRGRAASTI